ncbi:hypothetical protein [Priestia megaterium]|uniref:hypothetical protein n=1 Tax=Priestia megaterium TaxID=1404 RepID=UPI001126C3E2|nr:hypothetical protein [Priestia megaterium]TPF18097.1 hypothetical protein CBE78_02385 [Priestia megaterium]TPF22204.1 hypothetical protein CBE79_04890 [Priestia megaterium]
MRFLAGEYVKLKQDYLTFKEGEIVFITEVKNPNSRYDYKVDKTIEDSYGYLIDRVLEYPSDEETLDAIKSLRDVRSKQDNRKFISKSTGGFSSTERNSSGSPRMNNFSYNSNVFEHAVLIDNVSDLLE